MKGWVCFWIGHKVAWGKGDAYIHVCARCGAYFLWRS